MGSLDDAERQAVRGHLSECPACRAELKAWQTIRHATREAFQAAPPDEDVALQQVFGRIDAARSGEKLPLTPLGATVKPGINGWATPPAQRGAPPVFPAARRHWAPAHFATALLVLVTLGLGYLTIGPRRPNAERPVGLPAVIAPAATDWTAINIDGAAGVRVHHLLEGTISIDP